MDLFDLLDFSVKLFLGQVKIHLYFRVICRAYKVIWVLLKVPCSQQALSTATGIERSTKGWISLHMNKLVFSQRLKGAL